VVGTCFVVGSSFSSGALFCSSEVFVLLGLVVGGLRFLVGLCFVVVGP
jgi:hypothetical protein